MSIWEESWEEKLEKNLQSQIEFAKSLKPGEKVILENTWNFSDPDVYLDVVKRVSQKGWITLESGSIFMTDKYTSRHKERSGVRRLIPYSEELEQKAIEQEKQREEEKRRKKILNDAEWLCYEIGCRKKELTVEQAKKILEVMGRED